MNYTEPLDSSASWITSKHFLNFHSDISQAITAESSPLHTASTKQTFACSYVQT